METCHVLVIGDPGAGKTCLINRFLTGQFIHDQFLRLSQNSDQHKLHFIRDTRVKFVISETSDPGDPRLTSGDTDTVALLCFSLSRGLNLASVVSSWSSVSSNISTVLVGTMADTRDTAVNYNQAMAVAEQIGAATYIETSSKQSYTSVTSAFETAAVTVMPSLCRQPPALASDLLTSVTRLRHSGKFRRNAETLSKVSSLEYNKHSGSSTLTAAKKMFSLSSGSLHSKSSTLSSNKSGSSVLSVSTGRTPMLGRRNQRRVVEEEEQMVKIRVERLTRDKQVEEVEIEIPRSVYSNMRENTEAESDFVRNSGKRKSLACKLKNLILR